MPLTFTGRDEPAAEGASPGVRTLVVVVACFGAASLLAVLVFAMALRQHKVEAPPSAPPLIGVDRAFAAPAAPKPPAPAPVEPWITHPATPAQAVPPPPAAPPPAAPAQPRPMTAAVARSRMLAALRQVPHGTVTLSVEDDPAAQAYAHKLADLFRGAGWTVEQTSVFGPGPTRHGLAAAFGVSPSDEAVREAFDAVGFQLDHPPADAGVIRTPEIFVGAPY
jgi:hypothetical protein